MRVLIVLYEGFTEYEYQIPALAFHHFGVPFDAVGLETPVVRGMMGLKACLDRTLAEVDWESYTALLLPGLDSSTQGQVMQSERLMTLLREFNEAKKLIAAVCGAPVLLGNAGILKGRRFCSEIRAHPVFEGAKRVQESAVRDDNVITGLGARVFHFTALLLEGLTDEDMAVEYRRWAGIQEG